MIDEKFDAIVIGAGMSGNAAAYTLASRGLKVLQLERGEYPGSKNVQGGILYADMLEKIIPDFRDEAPLERHLVEQRFWFMTEQLAYRHALSLGGLQRGKAEPLHHHPLAVRPLVRPAGAGEGLDPAVPRRRSLELIQDAYGKVIGVRTDRSGGPILADVVVLAEGVNGLLGTRAGLRAAPQPGACRARGQGNALPAAPKPSRRASTSRRTKAR